MHTIFLVIFMIPILLFGQKSTISSKSKQLHETWEYSNSQSSIILYLSSTNNSDSLFLNYVVSSKKYIAGDEGQTLGWISKKKLLGQQEIITAVKNAEKLTNSFTVSIRYSKKSEVIFWKVLKCDDSLFVIKQAKFHKLIKNDSL